MDYVYAVLMLLGGIGAFLLGVKALADNTERLANSKIKGLLNKTSKSRLTGVGIGMITTAIIQSSGATTVMIVGLVNAGALTLFQATSMIMGAGIGTTVTAFISALSAFKLLKYTMFALAFIGIFMNMLCKKDNLKTIGHALAGLGLIFVGLEFMKIVMEGDLMNAALINILKKVNNPFLLLIIGFLLTTLMQSSSVVTAVLVVMAGTGLVVGDGGNAVLYVVLGANIGSTTTALISSIGTGANARRASLINLLFKTFGVTIFFVMLMCWPSFMDVTFGRWFANAPEMQIAMFHTAFNVVCTLLFLPFAEVFVKISELLIKDKDKDENETDIYLDKRLLTTPGVALDAITKEMLKLLGMSLNSLNVAISGFVAKDTERTEEVLGYNEKIDSEGKRISDYLINVSSQNISANDEKLVSALHNNVGDILRISELADNITKYTRREVKDGLIFSPYVNEKLEEMFEKIKSLANLTKEFVLEKKYTLIAEIDKAEDEIDHMRKTLIKDHIARLNSGECRAESSSVFINLVCNLERVGDHINYIAHAFLDLDV